MPIEGMIKDTPEKAGFTDFGLSQGILESQHEIVPTAIYFEGDTRDIEATTFLSNLRSELLARGASFYCGTKDLNGKTAVFVLPLDYQFQV